MSQVKRFRISGEIRKRGENLPFLKEFNAVKSDDAVENLYADIGSRHKARRFEIRVQKVEEVSMGGEQA
ncbi:50S ribosomal protein L18a [Candidatus Bathyarchaeota archaeon]|nr:MAG: 50S ribosomal protein L18a [Candidatus Bathyarchaeota archaeon]